MELAAKAGLAAAPGHRRLVTRTQPRACQDRGLTTEGRRRPVADPPRDRQGRSLADGHRPIAVEYGDHTAARVLTRVAAERLLDQLKLLDRHLWVDSELDRDWLREQSSVAMTIATAILEALPPVG